MCEFLVIAVISRIATEAFPSKSNRLKFPGAVVGFR